jgi:hypothetical protein
MPNLIKLIEDVKVVAKGELAKQEAKITQSIRNWIDESMKKGMGGCAQVHEACESTQRAGAH